MTLQRKAGFLLLAMTALLGACAPVTANRGNLVDADRLSEIQVGSSTRETVQDKLGSPTSVASFNENVWYYFGRRTEQDSFLDPDAIDRKVVRVTFDDNGVVKAVDDLTKDAPADVMIVDRETPTYGRENTLIQDLFGGIGRPGLPGSKASKGGYDR